MFSVMKRLRFHSLIDLMPIRQPRFRPLRRLAVFLLIFTMLLLTFRHMTATDKCIGGPSKCSQSLYNCRNSILPVRQLRRFLEMSIEMADRDSQRVHTLMTAANQRSNANILRNTVILEKEAVLGRLLPRKFQYCFIIQVHDRHEYLRILIDSLKNVKGIADILLIFSHDVWKEDINDLISSIDFAVQTQIFFPYSTQIYKHGFPSGDEQNNSMIIDNMDHMCLKDSFGHPRNSKLSQIKHHWWWKLNFVLIGIDAIQENTMITLLEEDFFLAPDTFHMLKLMQNHSECAEQKMLVLGSGIATIKQPEIPEYSELIVGKFDTFVNMGISLQANDWKTITNQLESFCMTDDYNWDYTLVIMLHSLGILNRACSLRVPRVVHVGEVGTHHSKVKMSSEANSMLTKAQLRFDSDTSPMYPSNISHVRTHKRKPAHKINGGWSDDRDRVLCLMEADPYIII